MNDDEDTRPYCYAEGCTLLATTERQLYPANEHGPEIVELVCSGHGEIS